MNLVSLLLSRSRRFSSRKLSSIGLMSMSSIFSPVKIHSDELIEYSSGSISISSSELNLKQTLLGGQSFRWFESKEDEFFGVLQNYIIRLKHRPDKLYFQFYSKSDKTSSENIDDRKAECCKILEDYFQISIDLSDLRKKWSIVDERFREGTIPHGVRVLAQDPVENLVSFICSSNNNVQRITKMIKLLSENFGSKIGTINGENYHAFPSLDQLDRENLENELRKMNFGYRARYIDQAVKYLRNTINDANYFDRLRKISVKEARGELMKIMGIGRKVADCILLMSLDKQSVVPVDTHIHSMAVTHYGYENKSQLTAAKYDGISMFFENLWQPMAGWAQAAAFSTELGQSKIPLRTIKRNHSKSDESRSVRCKKRNRSSK